MVPPPLSLSLSLSLSLTRYNRTMLIFSFVFLSSSLFFTRFLGSVGFILANCVNMLTRIIHSCYYIRGYFSLTPHTPLLTALPSRRTLGAFLIAFVITVISEVSLCFIPYILNVFHVVYRETLITENVYA